MFCTNVLTHNDYTRCRLIMEECDLSIGQLTPVGRFVGVVLGQKHGYMLLTEPHTAKLKQMTVSSWKHACAYVMGTNVKKEEEHARH